MLTQSSDTAESLTVLIGDDHRLLGEAVGNLLRTSAGYTVSIAETYETTMSALQGGGYDVVLLDLKMPGMNGLSSVKNVVDKAGAARVVLFTGQVDRHFLNSALEFGVRGLIPKTMPLQSLLSVIQLIASGQIFVPMQGVDSKAAAGGGDTPLSEKEHFVLSRAAEGLTNKEIARDMAISEVSVKMHMRAICRKLEARNRAHAVMISRERALI